MQNGVAVMVDCSRTDGCEQVLLELLTGLPALDQRREDASLVSRQHCDIVPQSFTITVELSSISVKYHSVEISRKSINNTLPVPVIRPSL